MITSDNFGSVFAPSSLVEVLRWRALQHPDHLAYTFLADGETEDVSITYGELDRQARAIGAYLQSMRVQGERALLLYPQGIEYIAAFFGCLYAKVIPIPLHPPKLKDRSLSRIRLISKDAHAKLALTTAAVLSKVDPFLVQAQELKTLLWHATDTVAASGEDSWQEPSIVGSTLALLQYTSGSTASPKGVMVSHNNLLHNLAALHRAYKFTQFSVFASWLPLFHDMGLNLGMLGPLYGGFRDILMSPAAFAQRPFRWLHAISHYKATSSAAPNFAYDLCVRRISAEQRASLDLSSWKLAVNGAEPVRAETIDRFVEAFGPYGFQRKAFNPSYGLAEATLAVFVSGKDGSPVTKNVRKAALEQNQVIEAPVAGQDSQTLVGCNQSLPDQKLVIVQPESFTKCSPNQVGEIWLSSPSITEGYWNQPGETEQTFRAYLADTGEGPFLRTGDLGFLQDGKLFITGRIKDLIIIRGCNHYPQDIELTVEQSHPMLRPGCGAAFSVEVAGEERLVVVQEVEYRQRPRVQEVGAAICRAVLEDHGVQVFAVVLVKPGTIPKSSSGKIRRRACRAAFLSESLNVWQSEEHSIEKGTSGMFPNTG